MTSHEAIIKTLNEVKDYACFMKFKNADSEAYKAYNEAFDLVRKWAGAMIEIENNHPTN